MKRQIYITKQNSPTCQDTSVVYYSVMENENKMVEGAKEQSWGELIRFAIIAVAIVVPIRLFIAEPFVVSGSSMVPSLENGDYLIIDKLSYRLGDPKRNDVLVFQYPNDPSKFFVKRIIGLPNETIDIRGNTVTITNEEYKNGVELDQPFVKNTANNDVHLKLKKDEYYVMGDNRPASSDSRSWGPLKREFVTGRVLLRLLPIKNIDLYPSQ